MLKVHCSHSLLIEDADKLTLGQEILITTPHAIEGVLKQPPDLWLSNAHMTPYESLLFNLPRIRFLQSVALKPASLPPDLDLDVPLHDCARILSQVYSLREDLWDQPLWDAKLTWCMDRSSFTHDGKRYAGAAVVAQEDTVGNSPPIITPMPGQQIQR